MISRHRHAAFLSMLFAASAAQAGDSIDEIRDRLRAMSGLPAVSAEIMSKTEIPAKTASNPRAEAMEKSPRAEMKKSSRAPASLKRKKRVVPTRPSASRLSQEELPVPEATEPREEENRLSKNWGGLRKDLSEKGIDLAVIYKAEFNRVLSGGQSRVPTYLGNVDFRLSIDAEKLAGWKGTSAFIYVLNDHGGQPSRQVGSAQATSNIEAPVNTTRIYEAWIQQLFLDGKVSVLAGLHDLNSEFYVLDSSGLFLNASFGVGTELAQTGLNGPSIFPNTSLALRARIEPSRHFYLQTAVFNAQAGDPNELRGTHFNLNPGQGFLNISEFGVLAGNLESHEGYGKYALGFWSYTEPFPHLTLPTQAGSSGVYFLGEQTLSPQVSVFLRCGFASSATNAFSNNTALGLTYAGFLPARPTDRLGIGLTRVTHGPEALDAATQAGQTLTSNETTYEFYYRMQLFPGLSFQPDFQYVSNPGTVDGHAFVSAARFELNF